MVVFVLAAACERSTSVQPTEAASASDLLITLERTPCLGACPSYIVSIDAEGRVKWLGREQVDALGEFEGRISTEAVTNLRARVDEIDFWNPKDEYRLTIMDAGSARLALRSGGRSKTIYVGAIGWPVTDASLIVVPDDEVAWQSEAESESRDFVQQRFEGGKIGLARRREFDALGELAEAIDLAAGSDGWIGTCERTFRFPCDW